MKNHFFIAYAGNKREEVNIIHDYIKPKLTPSITTIIEPFCGTSALSYYISTLYPKKYKYLLNDNNKYLIELYKICKNNNKINKFIKNVLKLLDKIDKDKYNEIIKKDTVEAWYIKHKIYCIRAGLFPNDGKEIPMIKSIHKFKECSIIKFIQNEDIEFKNIDAIDLIEQNNNEYSLIFLDPPYLNSCNTLYKCPTINIYEYLNKNKIHNMHATIILCLEDMWIIRLLFSENNFSDTYDKQYQMGKKKTNHIIITN